MSSPEEDCPSKEDPDFNPEESVATKRRGRKARASKFPNFVEHAAKQKLGKLQIKKEVKKQEKIEEIRRRREAKAQVETLKTRKIPTSTGLLKRRQLFRDEFLDLHCEWKNCTAMASRMEDFMRHVAKHVPDAEVIHNPPPLSDSFKCLWHECGFETINSSEMVRHINYHAFHTKVKCHGRNMLMINNMKPCKMDSAQRNILPDMSEPFQCEWRDCHMAHERWDNAQNFYWHVKGHAEDLEGHDIICGWAGCQRRDTAVSKLKEHLRCHSQERLVGCPTCGGLFANRVKFMDHCLKQQEGHSFACVTCEKKFAIERHLRDHMRSHVNHYKCPHCDMSCPTPSTLSSHIKFRHTTEKPFSCEFCSYRGKTMADIKSHIRVHYNDVRVKCPEEGCDFSCRAKITLKQHLQSVHSDNEPMYACHVCEERYYKGSDLTKHLVKAHSFTTPSGHSRFRYTKDSVSGLFRLQTTRFESFEMMETVTTTTSVRTSSRGKKKAVVKAEAASLSPEELGSTLAAAGDMVTASFDPSDSIIDVADLENIKVENIADGDSVLFSAESVSVSMPILANDPQGGSSDMVSVAMMAAIEHDEDIEAHNDMAPIDIKDLVTEEMSGVIVLPVQEGEEAPEEMSGVIVLPVQEGEEAPEGEILAAFNNQDSKSLEKDISLAPVILEDKDNTTSDSSQAFVQVRLDLQEGDTSLYHEENLDQHLKCEGIDPLEQDL